MRKLPPVGGGGKRTTARTWARSRGAVLLVAEQVVTASQRDKCHRRDHPEGPKRRNLRVNIGKRALSAYKWVTGKAVPLRAGALRPTSTSWGPRCEHPAGQTYSELA